MFGGDINLLSVDKGAIPRMDEYKLKNALEQFTNDKGAISSYVFNSGSVKRQFLSSGEDQIKEFVKGDGLKWGSSKIGNIYSQAVERHLVDSLRGEKVWWPGNWVHQPMGQGTKVYGDHEVIEMLYDLEEFSHYS